MKLNEYPPAIAKCQHELLKLEAQVRLHKEKIESLTAAADREIAFDGTLKNDQQRKAKRFEILTEDDTYELAMTQLGRLELDRAVHQIELELMKNTFSVLKLAQREAIARMESTIAA
ncbi:hypothetical protein ACKFKF_29680 [Phormidesmis sp. 146-12]